MGPQLEARIKELNTVRLRKVNIVKWGSDVAKQHGINSLPSLHLYDGNELESKSGPAVLAALN